MEVPTRTLGYDPKPSVMRWRGSPLPPVSDPVAWTSERQRIAERVFWQGPSWGILRNGVAFIHQIMEHGWLEDAAYAHRNLPRALWTKALDAATPKKVSRRSFWFWSHVFGRDPDASPHDWADSRHIGDALPRGRLTRVQRRIIAGREHQEGQRGERAFPGAGQEAGAGPLAARA